jgi:predicted NBD/HSP70 family sugar kinase
MLAEVLAQTGSLTATDAAYAAERGDLAALALFTEAGTMIGGMLATVVNLLNPSLIVIGGGVAGIGDSLLATIRQTIYARSLPLATRELLVQRSVLGHRAGVIGAASIVIDELFSRARLAHWLDAGTPSGMPELATFPS